MLDPQALDGLVEGKAIPEAELLQEDRLVDQIKLSVFKVLALERLGRSREALALAEENLKVLQLRTAQYSRHPLFNSYLALTLAQLGRRELAFDREGSVSFLEDAFDDQAGGADDQLAVLLEEVRGDHGLRHAGLVFQGDEEETLGRAGTLPHDDRAGGCEPGGRSGARAPPAGQAKGGERSDLR